MSSTQRLSMNLGLAVLPETRNPEIFPEAQKIYNAINILAYSLDSYTGALQQPTEYWSVVTPQDTIKSQGQHRLYVKFSEVVALGNLVTLYDDAGVLTAKKAGGSPWQGDVRGYCSTVGGVLNVGDYGEVILFGLHPYISGATPGMLYYVSSSTPGLFTDTAPTVSGEQIQAVGYALSDDSIFFNPQLVSVLIP